MITDTKQLYVSGSYAFGDSGSDNDSYPFGVYVTADIPTAGLKTRKYAKQREMFESAVISALKLSKPKEIGDSTPRLLRYSF